MAVACAQRVPLAALGPGRVLRDHVEHQSADCFEELRVRIGREPLRVASLGALGRVGELV